MTDKKIILGLTGLMGSGKGTVVEYAVRKYGASAYSFSTILRDLLKRLHLDISRHNLQKLSLSLRQTFGEDLLARVMAADAGDDNSAVIVIDSIRRLDDIIFLKKNPAFRLARIVAGEKIRYNRIVERGENRGDEKKTYTEFQEDHKANTEVTIPPLMAEADIEIDNNGSLDDLYAQVDKIIKI